MGIGGTHKTITLSGKGAELLRPYVIQIIQYNISNTQDYEAAYEAESLAEAFTLSPRDVGFDFESWREFREARAKISSPYYGSGMGCNATPVPGFVGKAAWH